MSLSIEHPSNWKHIAYDFMILCILSVRNGISRLPLISNMFVVILFVANGSILYDLCKQI